MVLKILNQQNLSHFIIDVFFIFPRVEQGSTSNAVILQSSTWYDEEGFTPAAYVTDHGNWKIFQIQILEICSPFEQYTNIISFLLPVFQI